MLKSLGRVLFFVVFFVSFVVLLAVGLVVAIAHTLVLHSERALAAVLALMDRAVTWLTMRI